MEVQVLILLVVGSSSALSPILSSLEEDSTNFQQTWQCSESWCNGSLTCSGMYKDSCPPGLLCKDGLCECPNQYPHMVTCDNVSLSIIPDYCATFDNETVVIGHCIYNSNPIVIKKYRTVNDIVSMKGMCNVYNRTGTLCGRCLPDHYPLAYSYNMTCIPCPHARWNWFRYIMAAYLPLTLFYLVILFFKINTTTSHLFALVHMCQLLSQPVMAQGTIIVLAKLKKRSYLNTLLSIFSLYGIWNLDFFRPFYSDLCLGIGILPTLALDYAIAVYPLLLMIITYLLIVLHNKNYRVVTIVWRPFQILIFLFRKNWSIKTSLIDAFSTFFLLSNIKFLSVSFAFLSPVLVHHLHGDYYDNSYGLYYAGDIEYFGSEHLPYAILAIAVLCVFVILPVIVFVLYPFSFFQKFLNLFPFRWYILHTFMDSFLGCYKDGTEPGTRDCRWFVSVFYIARIVLLLAYSLTFFKVFIAVASMILIVHTTLLAILQPFRGSMSHLNVINIIFLQVITLIGISLSGGYDSMVLSPSLIMCFFVLANVLGVIPLLYMLAIIMHWIYTNRLFGLDIMQRLRAWRNGYEFLNDRLPDRIENSDAYPRKNLANFVSGPLTTPVGMDVTSKED